MAIQRHLLCTDGELETSTHGTRAVRYTTHTTYDYMCPQTQRGTNHAEMIAVQSEYDGDGESYQGRWLWGLRLKKTSWNTFKHYFEFTWTYKNGMNAMGCIHMRLYWLGSSTQGAQGDYMLRTSVIDATAKAVRRSHLIAAVQPQQSQPCVSDVAKGMNDVAFRFVPASQMNKRKRRLHGSMSVMQREYDDNHELRQGCVLFDIRSRQQRRTFIATLHDIAWREQYVQASTHSSNANSNYDWQ